MKKVMKLELPKNSEVLDIEEMLQNESGWYVNFQKGEIFITYRDVNKAINWVQSMVNKMNNTSDISVETADGTVRSVKRSAPALREDDIISGGIGIRFGEGGFQIFQLDGEDLELANTNSLIF